MAGTLTCPTCKRVYANTLAACPFCAVGAGAAVPAAAGPIKVGVGPSTTGRRPGQLGCVGQLAIVGVVLVIGSVIGLGIYVAGFWPTVRVVNVSGGPITVSVDGSKKLEVDAIKGEVPDAVRKFRVGTGKHVLEAVGADGKVIDHETVDITHGGSYLFAPKHGDTCFEVVTSVYGENATPVEPTVLNPRETFWKIDHSVDRWLQDSPDSMEVDVGSTGYDTAVRELDCSGGDDEGGGGGD